MGAASGTGGNAGQSGNTQQSAPPPRMPSGTVYPTFTTSSVATGSPEDVGNVDAAIRQNVQGMMGDYRGMVNLANQAGISQADIARAGGVTPGNVYSYMNRPNYQAYGPNGQFYQPIYQSGYQGYAQPSMFTRPSYNPFAYGGGMGGMNLSYMYAEGGKIDDGDEGIAALRSA